MAFGRVTCLQWDKAEEHQSVLPWHKTAWLFWWWPLLSACRDGKRRIFQDISKTKLILRLPAGMVLIEWETWWYNRTPLSVLWTELLMKQFLNCWNLQPGIFKVNKHQFSLGQKATFIIHFQLHKIYEYLITCLQLSL